tara:strand:- start:103 stop:930 length:828 start_codon:yes stop_codon:yes gene_type:complete
MSIPQVFKPWIWCLSWLLIFAGSLVLLEKNFYEDAIMPNCELEYDLLSKQQPSSINSPLIMALGDSLLKHATPKTQWLDKDLRWYRANIPAAQQKQFLPILYVIEKVQPRILLIQDSLLLNRKKLKLATRVKKTARYLVSIVLPIQTESCNRALNDLRPTIRAGEELLDLRISYREQYTRSMTLTESSKKWLIQLKNISDKVVVVHFPRSITQSDNNGSEEWLQYLGTELAKLNIEVLSVGTPLDDTYYRDGAHVNQKGREVRMQELGLIIESRL